VDVLHVAAILEDALQAVREGEEARKLAEHAGWKIVANMLAPRAWTHYEFLYNAKTGVPHLHREAIRALRVMFDQLQAILDRAEDAELWLNSDVGQKE